MPENANVLLVNRAIIRDKDRILLVKRSESDSYRPGMWEFPGGKVDADEELAAGLRREVLEETGLVVDVPSSFTHVESELIQSGKYEGRLYVALFRIAERLGGNLSMSSEHQAAYWESSKQADEYELTAESRRALIAFRTLGII